MKTNIEEWLKTGAYLPAPLRDFHDQKDVFQTMHSTIDPSNQSLGNINWLGGHCYVIDIFLWFMARRGWTLQRSRVDADFRDLGKDIASHRDQQAELFRQILTDRKKELPSINQKTPTSR